MVVMERPKLDAVGSNQHNVVHHDSADICDLGVDVIGTPVWRAMAGTVVALLLNHVSGSARVGRGHSDDSASASDRSDGDIKLGQFHSSDLESHAGLVRTLTG